MDFLFVLASVLLITVLIVVHEFGHFLAAKFYGFQTPVFGIGLPFGPGIDLFKKWGTQFKFYFALIGGFVAIPELGDETDDEMLKKYKVEKPLREFPVYQRAVVASGGIVFNILFGFLIAVVMAATIGLPKSVPSNSIAAFTSTESIAKKAGLISGDKITSVNGIEVKTGEELKSTIQQLANQEVQLKISRPVYEEVTGKKKASKKVVSYEDLDLKVFSPGALGIVLGQDKVYEHYGMNPIKWIWNALIFTGKTIGVMFVSIIALLIALIQKVLVIIIPGMQVASVDLGEVKGIVGIVQIISEDIRSNAFLLLEFAYLLSLNLAVINVLPIPALDGGHLAFMAYEGIAGKKPAEKFQEISIQIGFAFLLTLILITTFNDIKNWIFQ